MKCPRCQKDVKPEDHYCPHCGYDLKGRPQPAKASPMRMLPIALIVLGCLILPFAYALYGNDLTSSNSSSTSSSSSKYTILTYNEDDSAAELYDFTSLSGFQKKVTNASTFIKPLLQYQQTLETKYGKTFKGSYHITVYANNDMKVKASYQAELADHESLVITREYVRSSETDTITTEIIKNQCTDFESLKMTDQKELMTSLIGSSRYQQLMKTFATKETAFNRRKKAIGHYGIGAFIAKDKISLSLYQQGSTYQSRFTFLSAGDKKIIK